MKIHHNTVKKAAKFKIALSVEDNVIVAKSKDGAQLASGLQGNKVLEDAITKLTGHAAKKSTAKAPKGDRPSKKARKGKKVFAKEAACREAGWTKRKSGGFRQTVEGKEAGDSAAKNWDELYIELVEAGDIEADEGRSGFKDKYKEKYKATQGRCGDELGERITAHCEVQGDDGRPRTGKTELKRFAEANDCWVPAYGSLTTKSGAWNAGSARASVANRLRAKIRHAKKDDEQFKINWA